MIYAILIIVFLVGVIGFLWTDNVCLKEMLEDERDANWELTAELDPVELYSIRQARENK